MNALNSVGQNPQIVFSAGTTNFKTVANAQPKPIADMYESAVTTISELYQKISELEEKDRNETLEMPFESIEIRRIEKLNSWLKIIWFSKAINEYNPTYSNSHLSGRVHELRRHEVRKVEAFYRMVSNRLERVSHYCIVQLFQEALEELTECNYLLTTGAFNQRTLNFNNLKLPSREFNKLQKRFEDQKEEFKGFIEYIYNKNNLPANTCNYNEKFPLRKKDNESQELISEVRKIQLQILTINARLRQVEMKKSNYIQMQERRPIVTPDYGPSLFDFR